MNETNLRTRREFMANCGVVTAGMTLPAFLTGTIAAAAESAGWEAGSGAPLPGFKDDRVLIVVQLSGGNDGLNTVIPYSDDAYHRNRPRLAVPKAKQLRLDDEVAFHENMKSMKTLWDSGKLSVVEGVGYPNPNRSHFRSMEIWQTSVDSNKFEASGWLGRYFDNHCNGEPQPTAGVFLGGELPQAFFGRKGMGVAFKTPDNFGYVAGKKGDDSRNYRAMNRPDTQNANRTLDFVRHVTDNANISTDRIQKIAKTSKNAIEYPRTRFAQDLAGVARMIVGGLPTRVYYVALSGFDTHANQQGSHERLLTEFSDGVAALYLDLREMGISERVTIMSFSEFGRRVAENASGGTDHGTAGPMFVIGDNVRPGLHGIRPGFEKLDQGDLIHTTDFRSVYSTVLADWFDIDAATVLGREFERLNFISA